MLNAGVRWDNITFAREYVINRDASLKPSYKRAQNLFLYGASLKAAAGGSGGCFTT